MLECKPFCVSIAVFLWIGSLCPRMIPQSHIEVWRRDEWHLVLGIAVPRPSPLGSCAGFAKLGLCFCTTSGTGYWDPCSAPQGLHIVIDPRTGSNWGSSAPVLGLPTCLRSGCRTTGGEIFLQAQRDVTGSAHRRWWLFHLHGKQDLCSLTFSHIRGSDAVKHLQSPLSCSSEPARARSPFSIPVTIPALRWVVSSVHVGWFSCCFS